MSSRQSSKLHGYNHGTAGHPNSFTSSSVNAEYKAALSVFNDQMLTEACNLLLQPQPAMGEGSNQVTKGDETQRKFQAMYQKCKTACNTIAKTEAMPGFLKSHQLHMNVGMQKKGGMGLDNRMSMSAASQSIHRPSASQVRSSSQMPTPQYKPKLNSLMHRGAAASATKQYQQPSLKRSSSTGASSSNSNVAGRNLTPPKSALKFLEALNNRPHQGQGAIAGGASGRKGGSLNPTSSAEKRKRDGMTHAGARKKIKAATKDVDDNEEEEEFEDGDSSDDGSKQSIKEDENDSDDDKSSSDSDASVASNKGVRKSQSPAVSPSKNNNTRRSTRARSRTEALTYEVEQTKVVSKKDPEPSSTERRSSTRKKKPNAPTKATGETFEVGDEILVYHEPDDKWYESIVSNVIYSNEDIKTDSSDAATASGKEVPKIASPRRSGRNRSTRSSTSIQETKLVIGGYDVEYDNGETESCVSPVRIVSRYQ